MDPVTGALASPASRHPYAYAFNNPANLVDPSGLSGLDFIGELFSLPGRNKVAAYLNSSCRPSGWQMLRDPQAWDVALTFAAYLTIPVLAAQWATWLLLPLAVASPLVGGLAVLGMAAVVAGGGTALLNRATGEEWHHGVGLAALSAMGQVWARSGGGFQTQARPATRPVRREGPGAMTATRPTVTEPHVVCTYGDPHPGLVAHHGVPDIWLSENVPGYVYHHPDSVVVTLEAWQHHRTIAVFGQWKVERVGFRGSVYWSSVGPREMQVLAEAMFDAAQVPWEVRAEYYRALHAFIYGLP